MIEEVLGFGILLTFVVMGYAYRYDKREDHLGEDAVESNNRHERKGNYFVINRFKEGEDFNSMNFRNLVRNYGIDDSYGNEVRKRAILRDSGYRRIMGKGGRIIDINEAPDEQIGAIFRKLYSNHN